MNNLAIAGLFIFRKIECELSYEDCRAVKSKNMNSYAIAEVFIQGLLQKQTLAGAGLGGLLPSLALGSDEISRFDLDIQGRTLK